MLCSAHIVHSAAILVFAYKAAVLLAHSQITTPFTVGPSSACQQMQFCSALLVLLILLCALKEQLYFLLSASYYITHNITSSAAQMLASTGSSVLLCSCCIYSAYSHSAVR